MIIDKSEMSKGTRPNHEQRLVLEITRFLEIKIFKWLATWLVFKDDKVFLLERETKQHWILFPSTILQNQFLLLAIETDKEILGMAHKFSSKSQSNEKKKHFRTEKGNKGIFSRVFPQSKGWFFLRSIQYEIIWRKKRECLSSLNLQFY